MSQQEINEILNSISRIDFEQVKMNDMLILSAALLEFAEKAKPIVLKYVDKLPESTSFLFKM